MCARGYAVFMPNFRGSTGYGTEFLMAIRGDMGDGPAGDIFRGIDYLVRKKVVDPKEAFMKAVDKAEMKTLLQRENIDTDNLFDTP